MSDDLDIAHLSDDELIVAYLDAQLTATDRSGVENRLNVDQDFRQRFEFLAGNTVAMDAAFAALLKDAPIERMASKLPPIEPEIDHGTLLKRRRFLSAGLVAAGVVAGAGLTRLLQTADSAPSNNWRAVVASYMQLYSTETLNNLTDDPAVKADQIARVAKIMQLPLTTQGLAIPGIPFKRAQLLTFEGKALAQIAYLDPQYGPLALCITDSTNGSSDLGQEQRLGMNIVFWSSSSHSFMVIGRNPPDDLKMIARQLRAAADA